MKLSVVIVNYNVRFYLEQCLRSVKKAIQGLQAEVWVVDNHSSDGSLEYLRPRFPWVNFVPNLHNEGFSKANNLALRQCHGEYALLLNPDTIVAEDTLREALRFMEAHPDAGALGVRMLNPDGTSAPESRRGIPSPMTAFYKLTGLCRHFPHHPRLGHYYMGGISWQEPHEIEVVSGAFCLLRRTALSEVGFLDEDFFMYGEDIDLSYRLLRQGYHNYYLPALILHYKGESTRRSSFRHVHVFHEAMLIFLRKHYAHFSFPLLAPLQLAIYLQALLALTRMGFARARHVLGFFPRKRRKSNPLYIFLGRESSLNECRTLAQAHGLDAQFVEGSMETLPQGHLSRALSLTPGKETFIVYDTEAYPYSTILQLFAQAPKPKVALGTYDPSTKTLITPNEILR